MYVYSGYPDIDMFDKMLTSFAAAMEERLATVNGATTTDGQAMNASANTNDAARNPIDMSPPPTVDHPSVSSFCNWIWHDADFSFASNPATPPTFPDFPQTSEDMGNVMALLPQVSGPMDLMEGLPAMDMTSNFNNHLVPLADMLNTTPLDQTAALLPDLYHSDRYVVYQTQTQARRNNPFIVTKRTSTIASSPQLHPSTSKVIMPGATTP